MLKFKFCGEFYHDEPARNCRKSTCFSNITNKGRQKCLFRKKGKSKVVRRSNASAGEGLFVVKNR